MDINFKEALEKRDYYDKIVSEIVRSEANKIFNQTQSRMKERKPFFPTGAGDVHIRVIEIHSIKTTYHISSDYIERGRYGNIEYSERLCEGFSYSEREEALYIIEAIENRLRWNKYDYAYVTRKYNQTCLKEIQFNF